MYNPGEELSSLAFDKIIGGALDAVVKAQNNSSMTTVNFIKTVGFINDEKGNPIKPVYVEFKYPKEIKPYQAASSDRVYLQILESGTGYKKENISETYNIIEDGDGVKVAFEVNSEGGIISATFIDEIDLSKFAKIKKGELTLIANADMELGSGAKINVVVKEGKREEEAVFTDMTLQVPILTMLPIPFIRVATTDIELNVKINSMSQTASSESSKSSVGSDSSFAYKGWGVNASCSINASIANQKQSSSSEEVKKEFSLNIKVHAVQDEIPVGLSRILDILEESIVPKMAVTTTAPASQIAASPANQ